MSLEQQSQLEDTRFGLLPFDLFALVCYPPRLPSEPPDLTATGKMGLQRPVQ